MLDRGRLGVEPVEAFCHTPHAVQRLPGMNARGRYAEREALLLNA